MNIHIVQLAYLREVARSPSWSVAAERLNISQPALSQSLRELERRLGVTLFEKSGRKQRLTAVGEEVVEFAVDILTHTDEFMMRLAALERGEVGDVRVGMIDAVCLYLAPRALEAFRRAHPDVNLRASIGVSRVLLDRLKSFEIDVAILVGPAGPEWKTQLLLEEELSMYRPAGSTLEPQEAPWLLYRAGSHTRSIIDAAFVERSLRPNVVLEDSNPQVMRQMVAMGFGWSILPTAVVKENSQGIEAVSGGPLAKRPIEIVRRPDTPDDPRVDHLVTLLREVVNEP